MDKEFFLPKIDEEALNEALAAEHPYVLMGALVEPLHEELYRRQTFDFMEELTEGQQLILCFDYVMMQVKGGGFLQLLHNGYAGLLIDLPEQLKAIQRELGNSDDEGDGDEIAELTQKIATLKLSKEARAKATSELKKLKTMAPMSAEATVVRNYIDWLVKAPWKKRSKIRADIAANSPVINKLGLKFD